jgi:hypothetical protein
MQMTSMGEARALFCRKLVEAQEARDQKMEHEVKQWRMKMNHASEGVVVNGSGNGISWITWTQGEKGARSISEKDQALSAPLC